MIDLTDGESRALSYVAKVGGESHKSHPHWWEGKSKYATMLVAKGLLEEGRNEWKITDKGRKVIGAVE